MLLQHDAARVGEDREERVLAAQAPEQRDREPEPVAGAEMLALADVPHVLDQGEMLKLDALGQRRGARGVEQAGDILAAHGGLRALDRRVVDGLGQLPQRLETPRRVIGRAAHAHDLAHARKRIALPAECIEGRQIIVLEEAIDRDEEARIRMGEQVGELPRRRPSVDCDQGAAEQRDGEIGEDPLGPVAHEDADLVAATDAERVQALGEPAHRVAQRAVAEARACADQCLVVGIARRQLVEQVRNRLRVGRPHGVDLVAGRVAGA